MPWMITSCERCGRDNTRCVRRAGEWVCTSCHPDDEPALGQLELRDGVDLGHPEFPPAARRYTQNDPEDPFGF